MPVNIFQQGLNSGDIPDSLIRKVQSNTKNSNTNTTNINEIRNDLTEITNKDPRKDTGIYIPFYQAPLNVYTNVEVDKVCNLARENYNEFSTVAVLNPNNGPDTIENANYTACIDLFNGAGAFTLGYVYTQNGDRASADVLADIETWYNFYPNIQGIFLDEFISDGNVSITPSLIDKYTEYYNLVKSKGGICDGNVGTYTEEVIKYQGVIYDKIITYENNDFPTENVSLGNKNSTAPRNYNKKYRGAIIWGQDDIVAEPNTVITINAYTLAQRFGYIFITQDGLNDINPFDQSSIYYDTMKYILTKKKVQDQMDVQLTPLSRGDVVEWLKDRMSVYNFNRSKYLQPGGGVQKDYTVASQNRIINIGARTRDMVFMTSGEIMLIPEGTSGILGIYNTITDAMASYSTSNAEGSRSFAIVSGGGDVIVFPLDISDKVLHWRPDSNTFEFTDDQSINFPSGSVEIYGGCINPENKYEIILCLRGTNEVIAYNWGFKQYEYLNIQSSTDLTTFTTRPPYWGCYTLPDGHVIFVPHDKKTAGILDIPNGTFTDSAVDNPVLRSANGHVLPNGKVLFTSRDDNKWVQYDPNTDTYGFVATMFSTGDQAIATTMLPNSWIFVSLNGSTGTKYNTIFDYTENKFKGAGETITTSNIVCSDHEGNVWSIDKFATDTGTPMYKFKFPLVKPWKNPLMKYHPCINTGEFF